MVSGWMFLMFVATAMADLSVDCGDDFWVTVRWRPELDFPQDLDPSRALLGNCPPSFQGSGARLIFRVSLWDCGFVQQVTPGRVSYSNTLIYDPRPELAFISQPLLCVYDQPAGEQEPDEAGGPELFSMEIMNPDFSGPAPSLRFRLGSRIPVRASVEPRGRTPLRIYPESCEFTTDANISRSARVHPVIANAGCLMDSKAGNSSFLPRRRPDELLLLLEALRFAVGEQIFLHCVLAARAVQSLTVDRKACQYEPEQRRWMLLDDPSQSYACSCCESSCPRTPNPAMDGVKERKVLGPLVIVENELQSDASLDRSSAGSGLSEVPVWLLVFAVASALMVIMAALAVSYYLCFWRGGRLGYRPSRDLLTKY